MTQPENRSYPKHGQLWWCDTVGRGLEIVKWVDGWSAGVSKPIARVLTPDEAATKNAMLALLFDALGEIEYREQPQNRGRPYRISIREVAQSALHEARSMVK